MTARGPRDPGAPARFSETSDLGAGARTARVANAGTPLDPATAALDARIGALLRKVPPPLPLPPARQHRVALQLAGQLAGAPRRRRRWAILALVLAGASSLAFAAETLRGHFGARPRPAASPVAVPAPSTVAAPAPVAASAGAPVEAPAPPPIAAAAPVAASAQPPVVARATRAAAAPPRAPARRPQRPRGARTTPHRLALAPQPAPVAPRPSASRGPATDATAGTPSELAPPDPTNIADLVRQPVAPLAGPPTGRPRYARLGEETAVLRRALESLRHDDDPAGALDAVDEYDRRFPFGVLRAQAQLVRIDALVSLGRKAEALALLETIDLAGNPRADDLLITRGELRAASDSGDCHAAMADFSSALARGPDDARAERALRGRALCARRLGDAQTLRADLEAYLARFPRAAFARRARKLLDQ